MTIERGDKIKSIQDRLNDYKKKGIRQSESLLLEKAFEQAKRQEYKRMHRIYEHVRKIFENENAYFITLTYSDDMMQYACNDNAKNWAKKNMSNYIGNDDYGTKGGRYHHHIFGNLNELIDLVKSWKYGRIDTVPLYNKNPKAIGKYIARIKNHAIKDGTTSLFRSREKRKSND